MIRRYSNAEIRNNTERFRFQNLASRYNTFAELWAKRLRAMEEGRPVGLHGKARGPGRPRRITRRPSSSGWPRRAAPSQRGPGARTRPATPKPCARSSTGSWRRASRRGRAAPVKFESFQKIIAQQATRILNEKGAQAVDFRLETKDGKVSLKAKPVR